jgi:hypothetical protein
MEDNVEDLPLPTDINDERLKRPLGYLLSEKEYEEGSKAFVEFVEERQKRVAEVRVKLMAHFGLSERDYKELSGEKLVKLVEELHQAEKKKMKN